MNYPNVGCGPYGYTPYGGMGGVGANYAPPQYPLTPYHQWSIVGGPTEDAAKAAADKAAADKAAADKAAAGKTFMEKVKDFGAAEHAGIKTQNWILAVGALGVIYYGYTKDWFGGHAHARGR